MRWWLLSISSVGIRYLCWDCLTDCDFLLTSTIHQSSSTIKRSRLVNTDLSLHGRKGDGFLSGHLTELYFVINGSRMITCNLPCSYLGFLYVSCYNVVAISIVYHHTSECHVYQRTNEWHWIMDRLAARDDIYREYKICTYLEIKTAFK